MKHNIKNLVESYFDDYIEDEEINVVVPSIKDHIKIGDILWQDYKNNYYISNNSNELIEKSKNSFLTAIGICYNIEDTIDFFGFNGINGNTYKFNDAEKAVKVYRKDFNEMWTLANIVDIIYLHKNIGDNYINLYKKLSKYPRCIRANNKIDTWIYGIDIENNKKKLVKYCTSLLPGNGIIKRKAKDFYYAYAVPVLTITDTQNYNILNNARFL